MGKQNKRDQVIKINTKRLGGKRDVSACTEELQSFFACLAKSGSDFDSKCAKERKDLTACATASARRPKVVNTINYHLQRISRLMNMVPEEWEQALMALRMSAGQSNNQIPMQTSPRHGWHQDQAANPNNNSHVEPHGDPLQKIIYWLQIYVNCMEKLDEQINATKNTMPWLGDLLRQAIPGLSNETTSSIGHYPTSSSVSPPTGTFQPVSPTSTSDTSQKSLLQSLILSFLDQNQNAPLSNTTSSVQHHQHHNLSSPFIPPTTHVQPAMPTRTLPHYSAPGFPHGNNTNHHHSHMFPKKRQRSPNNTTSPFNNNAQYMNTTFNSNNYAYKRHSDTVPPHGSNKNRICCNCGTSNTPFWRKDRFSGLPLCNACGLYVAKNDHPRPVQLWKAGDDDADNNVDGATIQEKKHGIIPTHNGGHGGRDDDAMRNMAMRATTHQQAAIQVDAFSSEEPTETIQLAANQPIVSGVIPQGDSRRVAQEYAAFHAQQHQQQTEDEEEMVDYNKRHKVGNDDGGGKKSEPATDASEDTTDDIGKKE